ncbi:MAG: hypothetical protein WA364_16435 [Candidatus Nitrosopolaris sp.]
MNESKTISNYIKNFPFTTLRHRQEDVLREIGSAFVSGYKQVILSVKSFWNQFSLSHIIQTTCNYLKSVVYYDLFSNIDITEPAA